jgi:hypothetical protein
MSDDALPKHGIMNRKERRRRKLKLAEGLDHNLATRKCGECTGCCTPLAIPELDKPPGVPCKHILPEGGCGIYETRPKACREYDCGWRIGIGKFEEERPDRLGLLLTPIASGFPGYPGVIVHELWPEAFKDRASGDFLQDVGRGLVVLLVRGDLIIRMLIPEHRAAAMKPDIERIHKANAEVRNAMAEAAKEGRQWRLT